MLAIAQVDRRAAPRHIVRRPAECRRKGRLLAGTVRDESDEGIFFALDCKTNPHEPTPIPYQPQLGDLVVLFYRGIGDHKLTVARVRWRGHSYEHGCEGLGLQFDDF